MRRLTLLLFALALIYAAPARALYEEPDTFSRGAPEPDDQGDYRDIRFSDSYGRTKAWPFWSVHSRGLYCRASPYGAVVETFHYGDLLFTNGRLVSAGQYEKPWLYVRAVFGQRFCWVRAHNDYIRPYSR